MQHFSVNPPGFVWDAAIEMAPLLKVRVRDSYIGGTGAMQARVASLISVVDERGSPELNSGALQRYLAEAVWFPAALLPSRGVKWEPIDDRTARAILVDGPTSVWLDFSFGEQGQIVRAYTPGRYRAVGGSYVPTPWTCEFGKYADIAE